MIFSSSGLGEKTPTGSKPSAFSRRPSPHPLWVGPSLLACARPTSALTRGSNGTHGVGLSCDLDSMEALAAYQDYPLMWLLFTLGQGPFERSINAVDSVKGFGMNLFFLLCRATMWTNMEVAAMSNLPHPVKWAPSAISCVRSGNMDCSAPGRWARRRCWISPWVIPVWNRPHGQRLHSGAAQRPGGRLRPWLYHRPGRAGRPGKAGGSPVPAASEGPMTPGTST